MYEKCSKKNLFTVNLLTAVKKQMLTPDYGVNLILTKAALYFLRLQTSALNAKNRIIF